MKLSQTVKNTAQVGWDTWENLFDQVKPIGQEFRSELGPFVGIPKRPKELAKEELAHARQEKQLQTLDSEDNHKSQEKAQRVSAVIQKYKAFQTNGQRDQTPLKQEIAELQSEVVQLAKAAGIDTKVHLEQTPKKVAILDIKRLTAIVRFLRMKAEDAKSAQELVAQRQNAKRPTGMLAWVSGKQMKVHEQGTLMLQG